MRWLVWYLRSLFCKHDWKFDEQRTVVKFLGEVTKNSVKVSATCKICGWHRAYWKYS